MTVTSATKPVTHVEAIDKSPRCIHIRQAAGLIYIAFMSSLSFETKLLISHPAVESGQILYAFAHAPKDILNTSP